MAFKAALPRYFARQSIKCNTFAGKLLADNGSNYIPEAYKNTAKKIASCILEKSCYDRR